MNFRGASVGAVLAAVAFLPNAADAQARNAVRSNVQGYSNYARPDLSAGVTVWTGGQAYTPGPRVYVYPNGSQVWYGPAVPPGGPAQQGYGTPTAPVQLYGYPPTYQPDPHHHHHEQLRRQHRQSRILGAPEW